LLSAITFELHHTLIHQRPILQCHSKGITGKNKILKEVWGVSAGSSQAYRDAKAEYEYLMPFIKEEEGG
jgi:hypothetical protein